MIILSLILALLASNVIFFLPTKAEVQTIIVPDNYSTIQQAINNAFQGDTIYVKKGVYVENPIVNKSISLIGENTNLTVIDITGGLQVNSNNVTITGFTIYNGWKGIFVLAKYCNIFGNKITDATNGIVISGNENNITGNILQSIGLSSAIQLNFANNNLINNNYIESCVEGIQIWQNSNNNTIIGNTIINCKNTAINFQYSNDNILIGNNISRSGLGTSIYGSNRNTITKNNYVYNIVQFGANETYYLSFGYNRSIINIDRNFWSNYAGLDANNDGIGDTPYIIDENNKDNHPLMKTTSTIDLPTPIPSGTTIPNTILPDHSSSINPNSTPEPFQTLTLAASIGIVAIGVASLLVYFKKHRHQDSLVKKL